MIYQFDDFEADEELFELRRGHERLELQRKPLKLLFYLAKNAPRVVPSDELLAALWPGLSVTDASLRRAVAALRQVLGEGAHWIGGVRGHGYQMRQPSIRAAGAPVPSHSSAPPALSAGVRRRLVGRRREIERLHAAAEEALSGRGQTVMLAGAPGLGKTRLAEQIAHLVTRRMNVIWGRCWEEGGSPPYWPWPEIVNGLLAPDRRSGSSLDELLLEPGAPSTEASSVGGQQQASLRFRLFTSVVGLVRQASQERPLLLIVEDLHGADEPALLLFKYLAREIATMRALLVGTYRPEGVRGRADRSEILENISSSSTLLPLSGLAIDEVGEFLRTALDTVPPAETVARAHELSGGNPLFLQELVGALSLGASSNLRELETELRNAVPLRAAIRRHLAPLSPGAKQVVAAAAVLGPECDLALLNGVLELPGDDLVTHLEEAALAQILADSNSGVVRFSHALFRELAYHDMPAPQRRDLHARAARALEKLGRGEHPKTVAAIAHHWVECLPDSEAYAKAIDYLSRAAKAASVRMAFEEAREHCSRALELIERSGGRDERWFLLQTRLADSQRLCGAVSQAREACLDAIAWARQHGTPEQHATAALLLDRIVGESGVADEQVIGALEEALARVETQTSTHRALLLSRLSVQTSFSSEHARASEIALEALRVARLSAEPNVIGQALSARLFSLVGWSDRDAMRLVAETREEALVVARSCTEPDTVLDLLGWGYVTLLQQGMVERAAQEFVRYQQQAAFLQRPLANWFIMSIRTAQAIWEGRFEEAEALSLQTFDYGSRAGLVAAEQYMGTHLFQLRREQGRLQEMLPMLQAQVAALPTVAPWRAGLAVACLELGDRDGARAELERLAHDGFASITPDMNWLPAVALIADVSAWLEDRRSSELLYEKLEPLQSALVTAGAISALLGIVDLSLGQLALALDDPERALGHLQAAHQLALRLGAPTWAARCDLALAEALFRARQPAHEEAMEHLRRAAATATRVGMPKVATRAEELLASPAS